MKIDAMNKLTRSVNKFGFKVRKHSPEILVGAGVVGVVASTVMACRATTKLSGILEETKQQVDQVHTILEDKTFAEQHNYTPEDGKKDLTIIYAKTGIQLAKLYAPSVLLGVVSIASILTSHRILSKRNVALAAAYATVDKGFKEYRSRVVERFGEAIDKELKYNVKAQEVEKTVMNEDGTEQTVKETKFVINPSEISEYARFFGPYTKDDKGKIVKNNYWCEDNEHNLVFLKQTERYANDRLKLKGFLFLNEVYEMLGLPKTKAGQIVGWAYDEKNPVGDNYVDFGLYKDNLSYSDFVNGYDEEILLDFNVDGNVWDMM